LKDGKLIIIESLTTKLPQFLRRAKEVVWGKQPIVTDDRISVILIKLQNPLFGMFLFEAV